MLSLGTPLQMLLTMSLSTILLTSDHWTPVGFAHVEQRAAIRAVSLGPTPWTIERRRSYALLHLSRSSAMTAYNLKESHQYTFKETTS